MWKIIAILVISVILIIIPVLNYHSDLFAESKFPLRIDLLDKYEDYPIALFAILSVTKISLLSILIFEYHKLSSITKWVTGIIIAMLALYNINLNIEILGGYELVSREGFFAIVTGLVIAFLTERFIKGRLRKQSQKTEFDKAKDLYEGEEYLRAFKIWEKLALIGGHAESQYKIAEMLENYKITEEIKSAGYTQKDAEMFYSFAAHQNHSKAQYKLGFIYKNKEDNNKDKEDNNKALKWLMESVKVGFSSFFLFGNLRYPELKKGKVSKEEKGIAYHNIAEIYGNKNFNNSLKDNFIKGYRSFKEKLLKLCKMPWEWLKSLWNGRKIFAKWCYKKLSECRRNVVKWCKNPLNEWYKTHAYKWYKNIVKWCKNPLNEWYKTHAYKWYRKLVEWCKNYVNEKPSDVWCKKAADEGHKGALDKKIMEAKKKEDAIKEMIKKDKEKKDEEEEKRLEIEKKEYEEDRKRWEAVKMGKELFKRNYYLNKLVNSDKETFNWVSEAAGRDCTEAIFMLGYMCHNGYGVSLDIKKAVKYYEISANKGDAESQFILGVMYYEGHGVKQSYKKAFKWFSKAAYQGHAGAQLILGFMYSAGDGGEQDYKEALKWYKKAAKLGYAEAQFALGDMYYQGQGVEPDDEKAFEWFTKAAEQEHAFAQFNLAAMYMIGEGVGQSHEKAFEWYKKAAENGYASAQYKLALMHQDEQEGVKQSDEEACKWFFEAAKQGHVSAQKALILLADNGYTDAQFSVGLMYHSGEGVEKNYEEAKKWYEKAAEQEDATALYNLAHMYYVGEIQVSDSLAQAYKYYALAYINRLEEGIFQCEYLAKGEYEGKITKEEIKEAYELVEEWVKKSGRREDAYTQFCLGDMYSVGGEVGQSYEEALGCYKEAAEQGYVEAQFCLGDMYNEEEGMKDEKEAEKWYMKAANSGHPPSQCRLGSMYERKAEKVATENEMIKYYTVAIDWYKKSAKGWDDSAQNRTEDIYEPYTRLRDLVGKMRKEGMEKEAEELAKYCKKHGYTISGQEL